MTRLKITRNPQKYWSVHTHSRFSHNDALCPVDEIVAEAKRLGYRGLALTDHGNMAGSVQLYKECKKAGIKPFPGSEIYLVKDRGDKKAKRYHAGLVAYTTQGYRNLVHISTLSHKNFYNKPLLDLADLAQLHEDGRTEGVALTTGCYFGLVIQTLINDGYEACKQVVAMFASWFDTYVEIQAHDIEHEEANGWTERSISDMLMSISEILNLPVVITQDSHYTTADERELHNSLKSLVSFGSDPDDGLFPGDGFHLADDKWMQAHHTDEVYEAGLKGLERLLSKHDMYVPELEEYDYRIPVTTHDPLTAMKRRVIKQALKKGLPKKYFDRIDEEMEIIEVARMEGYMMMVAEICDHMRQVEMFFQIRGSAGGSVVCWLLGITSVDPLKWNLRMDRFLSKDRTKPPDIDIDVEHDRRKELLDWLGDKYALIQIGAYRAYSIEGEGDERKGSLRVRYLSRKRATGQVADWSKVTESEHTQMLQLSKKEVLSGYQPHPAGVIITTSRKELESQVPFMWVANSKTMVSQYDGDDSEAIGLVKLDVLGVKTLSVLRRCLINMGRSPKDGMDWIPLTDRATYKMIASGDTAGMFQLEGATAARGVKRLKPGKIGDVIAAMALFRPGVMSSGAMDSFLSRKSKEEETPQRHKVIMDATKETFGILLYQDQVIEILRTLGMGADDLTKFLKAVKASNKNVHGAAQVMEHYSPIVQRMCVDAGMGDLDVQWLWEALEAFAEYSFNRAHATIYGITAYRCAYLAVNHPLEFHAALLAVAAATDKERAYMSATRKRGIRLLKPCVNGSLATYSVDPKKKGIRRGLVAIKGIAYKTADEIVKHQPYKDMDDFAERVNPSTVSGIAEYKKTGEFTVGKMEALHDADAFQQLEGVR